MRYIFFFVMLCLCGSEAEAQSQLSPAQSKEVEQICSATACRDGGFEVIVRVDNDHYKTVPVGKSPFVTPDGQILVYPGETVAVHFSVKDGVLSVPQFLRQYAASKDLALQIDVGGKQLGNPTDKNLPQLPFKGGDIDFSQLPENTIVISYGQPLGSTGMMMSITSNLPQILKLNADVSLIRKGAYQWHYTSTCPIAHKSFESWPDPQGPILLSKFRYLPQAEKAICN